MKLIKNQDTSIRSLHLFCNFGCFPFQLAFPMTLQEPLRSHLIHQPTGRIIPIDHIGGYWWLPLPILQNTILIAVNQPLADFCFVTQNQRGTKTGQNHGKIKSRTLRPKYPLWNTSVSFAKVQICPLKNEGKSLFLSFTTHFPTIVPQMWLLQTVLTSNSMTCENRVLNFVLHSDGHFQKRELAIEPNICHPYCPIFGFVIV